MEQIQENELQRGCITYQGLYEKTKFHVIRLAARDCVLGTVGRFFADGRTADVEMGPERRRVRNRWLGYLEYEHDQLVEYYNVNVSDLE